MKGNDEVVQVLQDVLCAELTAVNQYFIHARMCENWGYKKLAAYIRKESIEEMQHAQEIIDRILYFDGAPNMQKYMKINVGKTVPEQFAADLEVEYQAVPRLNKGVEVARAHGDNGTRALLEKILADEEEHVDWLEAQLGHDQGDGRRELPRAADGMRKTTVALALGAAAALARVVGLFAAPRAAPPGPGRHPPRREAPAEPPAAHLRRRERRGLLERGREAASSTSG